MYAENQPVQEDMDFADNYGEEISRGCPKTHGLTSIYLSFIFHVFIV
jgi:hypothetical protein